MSLSLAMSHANDQEHLGSVLLYLMCTQISRSTPEIMSRLQAPNVAIARMHIARMQLHDGAHTIICPEVRRWSLLSHNDLSATLWQQRLRL